MNKRGAGISFIIIATLLFAVRYLSAAIYSVGYAMFSGSFGGNSFNEMLDYTGSTLLGLSVVAFIIGIVYLLWGEISERK